jgi:hypothetical protein
MNTEEPFNPFAQNAKEESLKRMKIEKQLRKQREKITYLPFDDSGISKFDYCWTGYTPLGDKIRPVVIFDKFGEHVFCAPISSTSEGEIRIPAVSENRPGECSWIHTNHSMWIPVTKLEMRKGIIRREGRLPLESAEEIELTETIKILKQGILNPGGGESS